MGTDYSFGSGEQIELLLKAHGTIIFISPCQNYQLFIPVIKYHGILNSLNYILFVQAIYRSTMRGFSRVS